MKSVAARKADALILIVDLVDSRICFLSIWCLALWCDVVGVWCNVVAVWCNVVECGFSPVTVCKSPVNPSALVTIVNRNWSLITVLYTSTHLYVTLA